MSQYLPQIQGIDLPGIYQAAQQARMRQMEMDKMRQDQERAASLRELMGQVMGPTPNANAEQALRQQFPQQYQELQEQKMGREKFELAKQAQEAEQHRDLEKRMG